MTQARTPGRVLCAGLLLAATLAIAPTPTKACTANPNPIVETQPDGTEITLRFKGDQYHHWHEDLAGYTVVRDADRWVYATVDSAGRLAPTQHVVGAVDPDTTGLSRGTQPSPQVRAAIAATRLATPPEALRDRSSRGVPPTGTVKNLVVLMRFSDHGARTLPDPADYDVLFNAVGGDATLAPTGSVRDVYAENSYGAMELDSTVVAWVTLPNTEAYYANGAAGLDPLVHEAIHDALALVDPLVDFNDFDTDNDNVIDAIAFVHSGYAAEFGGTDAFGATTADRIWSHRWSTWSIGPFLSAEGVEVFDYHINPGVWSTSGNDIGRIGVIAHETGHFFGLPDLYDTDSALADRGNGIGSWGMMANSWGFDGTQYRPPHFCTWSKDILGWLTPVELTADGTYTIDRYQMQSATNPLAYKITTGFPADEYLLIENRTAGGFENNIDGGGGLVVFHIDELADFNIQGFPGQPGWPANGNHYRVAVLQRDGLYDLEQDVNRGDDGDFYRPGDELTDTTVPDTKSYQGGNIVSSDVAITNISAPGDSMTFSLTLPAWARVGDWSTLEN